MSTNLKLGDRLAIIKDGIKKGQTPLQAMLQYLVNKDGGYNAWKNTFKRTTGIDPDLDDTYNYELFFNENPEAAKQLVLGQVSPEILLMYKTPLAIQREQQVARLKKGATLNDMMDYSKFEKIINDYMNNSVQLSKFAIGGPINIYAEGTELLETGLEDIEDVALPVTEYGIRKSYKGRSKTPDFITVTPEEWEEMLSFNKQSFDFTNNSEIKEENRLYYPLSPYTFMNVPVRYIHQLYPDLPIDIVNADNAVTYYRDDSIEPDENGNYRLDKLDLESDLGKFFINWKENLAKLNSINKNSNPYDLYFSADDSESSYIPLDEVTVVGRPNAKKLEEHTNANTLIPIGSQGLDEEGKDKEGHITASSVPSTSDVLNENYLDVMGIGGDELKVPNNNPYSTLGLPGGSSFGTASSGIKMPDIFNLYQLYPFYDLQFQPYQWQQEELYYLPPPGYVTVPNWDVSLVYDPDEGADFNDFMMRLAGYGRDNSLRDELMKKLFEPRDYFADPYAGEHYTDTKSFQDVYNNDPYNKIQRESNGIPLYATGGPVNLFDGTHGSGYVSRALNSSLYSDFADIDGLKVVRISPSVFLTYWPDVYSWYPQSAANRDFLGYITPLGVIPVGSNSLLSKAIDKYVSDKKMQARVEDITDRAEEVANDMEIARGALNDDYDVMFYDNPGVIDPATGLATTMYQTIPYKDLWYLGNWRDDAAKRAYELDIAKGNTLRSTFRPAPNEDPDFGELFGVTLPNITVTPDNNKQPDIYDDYTIGSDWGGVTNLSNDIINSLAEQSHEAAILRGHKIDDWIKNLNIQDNPDLAAKLGALAAVLGALTYLTGGMGYAALTNPATTATALAAFGVGNDLVNSISAGIDPSDFAASGLRWEDIPLDRRRKTWDETASDILEPIIGRGLADLVGPLTNIGGLTHAGLLSLMARPVDRMLQRGVRNGIDAINKKIDTYRLSKELGRVADNTEIGSYLDVSSRNPNYRYAGPTYEYNGAEIPLNNRTTNISNILYNKAGDINKESTTGGMGRTLTLDAVKDFTDKDWDAAYFDAINRGNLEEVLNIRDLHHRNTFQNNVLVNDDGRPTELYHTTPYDFNTFDESKIGSHSGGVYGNGFYASLNPNYMEALGLLYPNKTYHTYKLYGNVEQPFNTNDLGARVLASRAFNASYDDIADTLYQGDVNAFNWYKKKFIDPFTDDLISSDAVIHRPTRPQNIESNPDSTMDTYDLEFYKDAIDKYGEDVLDEVNVAIPSQYKSADAITYDENGNIIPISKRDDWYNDNFLYTKMGDINKESLRAGMLKIQDAVNKAYKHLRKGYAEDIARADKMLADIDADISNRSSGIHSLHSDLFSKENEQEKIINDYFDKHPVLQEVSVEDIAGNIENMSKDPFYLEWELGVKNGLPYELKYNNSTGNFEITSKQLTGPSKYLIPKFGTDEWETGKIDLVNYFNKGLKSGELEIEPALSQGISMTYFGTPPGEIWKRINNDYSGKPKYFFENGSLVERPEITFNENPNQATTTTMFENAPLMPESLLKTIADNIAYVEKEIPGFKALGSSVSAREGTAARAPGDIDGYIAKSDFDKLPLDMRNRMTTDNGDTYQYQLDKSGRRKYTKKDSQGNILYNRKNKPDDWGIIDVNIVEIDKKGFGNSRAEQLYRLFYPELYHKAVIKAYSNSSNRGRIRMLDENGKVLTDTQLVLKYNPVVASIMDAMEANFLSNPTYKDKHAGRWYNYMIGDRPDVVSKALSLVTKMAFGEKGYKLPKLKFGTPKENEELLIELGYPKEAAHIIAKDNAKMQNAMDYWFISDRTSYRATGPGNMGDMVGTPQTITRNLTKWDVNAGGGTNWGGGLNSTLQGNSGHSGLVGRVQFNIKGLKEGMTPKEAIDKIDYQMGVSPITQADIDVLNAMGISHNLNVGDPVSELHAVLSPLKRVSGWRHGDEPIYNEFLEKSGRRGITSREYGQGLYFGEGPIDPSVDALGVSKNNYDIMGVKNRKEFIESLTGVDPSATTERMMYDASYLEANNKFLSEVQNFRANSQKILDIDKEILEIRKEMNKITNAEAAGFKARLRLEELKNKYERLERKRKRDLKNLTKIGIGSVGTLIVGLGGEWLYNNAKEKREELRKQDKDMFIQGKKIVPTFGTSTIEGNQELYELQ